MDPPCRRGRRRRPRPLGVPADLAFAGTSGLHYGRLPDLDDGQAAGLACAERMMVYVPPAVAGALRKACAPASPPSRGLTGRRARCCAGASWSCAGTCSTGGVPGAAGRGHPLCRPEHPAGGPCAAVPRHVQARPRQGAPPPASAGWPAQALPSRCPAGRAPAHGAHPAAQGEREEPHLRRAPGRAEPGRRRARAVRLGRLGDQPARHPARPPGAALLHGGPARRPPPAGAQAVPRAGAGAHQLWGHLHHAVAPAARGHRLHVPGRVRPPTPPACPLHPGQAPQPPGCARCPGRTCWWPWRARSSRVRARRPATQAAAPPPAGQTTLCARRGRQGRRGRLLPDARVRGPRGPGPGRPGGLGRGHAGQPAR